MKLLFDLVRATVIYTIFMCQVFSYYGRNPAYPELTASAMCFNELLLGGINEMGVTNRWTKVDWTHETSK